MKKLLFLSIVVFMALGLVAQSTYKMRVVKTDGEEIFFKTSEVEYVDFQYTEESEEPQEPTLKVFLAGDDVNQDGPCKVARMDNVGPDGGCILAYPENMSEDPNVKHGVVIWGPGGDTEPGAYMGMINRLVSHGFVVLALSSSPGNGKSASAAINWLEERNNLDYGVLSNKLIMDRVGCSGHSMGGLESEQALLNDSRVYTAILNNSGDLGHSAMSQIRSGKPIAIVYGEKGMEAPNAEADYNNSGVTAPACLIKMTGGPTNNSEGGYGHGSAAWDGIAATLAWMRWHIGGENRKDEFTTPNGQYVSGPIIGKQGYWQGKYKNWENWKED